MALPPSAAGAGVAVFDLHDPRVPVAEILYDSLLDSGAQVSGCGRRLLFETPTVCIEVRHDPIRRRLDVLFVPASFADVSVLQKGGSMPATIAGPGRASCERFQSGLTSLELRRDRVDGGPVRTAWLVL